MLIIKPVDNRDLLSLQANIRPVDRLEISCLRDADLGVMAQVEGFIEGSEMSYAVRDAKRDTLVCVFGLTKHSELDASPWMLGTDTLRLYPAQLCRWSKAFIDMCMEHYMMLHNYVHVDNTHAISFLKYCGFEILHRARVDIGGEPFYFFNRSALEWKKLPEDEPCVALQK